MRDKLKSKSFITALIIIVLAVALSAYFAGMDRDTSITTTEDIVAAQTQSVPSEQEKITPDEPHPEAKPEIKNETEPQVKQENFKEDKPEVKPSVPTNEPDETLSCTVRVTCKNLVGNSNLLAEKAVLVPSDGIILDKTVTFSEGDSAFSVLKKTVVEDSIHLDFSETSGSAYVKGINNLYEKDCGKLSGWIYMINGEIASVGSSAYTVSDGDIIEFAYTCDLGRDL